MAGPAGDQARRFAGRDDLAGGPRPARASGTAVLGDVEVLVAARPHRGTCPPGGGRRGQERAAAAARGDHRAELCRLHPHRQRRPGQGRHTARAEPALVPSGQRKACNGPDRVRPGSPRLPRGAAPRLPRATDLLGQSQALLREAGDDDLSGFDRLQHLLSVALVDNFLGQVRLSQGDNGAAARLFTDGLTVARRAQDRIALLVSVYDLALSSQAQGDLAGAAGHLKEGLALAAEAGDETSAAYYFEGLAAVAGQQDNPQRAARLLAAARSLLEAKGSGWLHAFVPRVPHDDAVLAALRSRMGETAFGEDQAR